MARAVDAHQLIREIDQQVVNSASRKITRERIGNRNSSPLSFPLAEETR
jgi:hypothetical protein